MAGIRDLEVINISVIVKVVGGKEIVQDKCTKGKKWDERIPQVTYLKRNNNKELAKETKNHQFPRTSAPRLDESPAWTGTWESSEETRRRRGEEQRTPGVESLVLSLPLTEKLQRHTGHCFAMRCLQVHSDRCSS